MENLIRTPPDKDLAGTPAGMRDDPVVQALTGPVRLMIAGVLFVNLSLGIWLIERSDFTGVKPQGSPGDALRGADIAAPASTERPRASESALKVAAANERN